MRSTAAASQVGLSHSTQARKPCSITSQSNGRLAGLIKSHLTLVSCSMLAARSPILAGAASAPTIAAMISTGFALPCKAGAAGVKSRLTRRTLDASL
jgi:hypothetical protein